MEQEIWKPVVGYEDLYHVSNMGRVKRLGGTPRCKEDRLLQGYKQSPWGHLGVTLYKNGIRFTTAIHRLVLETFVGPCPAGMEACHNNGDPSDNRLENLRWDTSKNNHTDMILHGTSTRGERHGQAKLTEHNVGEIRQMLARGMRQTEVAAIFGVGKSTINEISKGRAWGWLE